jgi:hypothetical protein
MLKKKAGGFGVALANSMKARTITFADLRRKRNEHHLCKTSIH